MEDQVRKVERRHEMLLQLISMLLHQTIHLPIIIVTFVQFWYRVFSGSLPWNCEGKSQLSYLKITTQFCLVETTSSSLSLSLARVEMAL